MQERDLFTLNLAYLGTAREFLAAGEHRRAQVLLGISDAFAQWLAAARVESVLALADSGLLCFQPRVSDRVLGEIARTLDDVALLRRHAALAAVTAVREDARSR